MNVIDFYASYLADQSEEHPEELAEIRRRHLLALGERTRVAEDLAVETVLTEVRRGHRTTVEADPPETVRRLR